MIAATWDKQHDKRALHHWERANDVVRSLTERGLSIPEDMQRMAAAIRNYLKKATE